MDEHAICQSTVWADLIRHDTMLGWALVFPLAVIVSVESN